MAVGLAAGATAEGGLAAVMVVEEMEVAAKAVGGRGAADLEAATVGVGTAVGGLEEAG